MVPLPFSLQESRPFSVDFFRKMIQFEKEQVSALSMHFSSGKVDSCLLSYGSILLFKKIAL